MRDFIPGLVHGTVQSKMSHSCNFSDRSVLQYLVLTLFFLSFPSDVFTVFGKVERSLQLLLHVHFGSTFLSLGFTVASETHMLLLFGVFCTHGCVKPCLNNRASSV